MRNLLQLIQKLILLLFVIGCSKDDESPSDPILPDNNGMLSGDLYLDWATEGTLSMNTKTGVKQVFLASNSKRNGWHVSQDKQLLLTASNLDIWSDDVTFVLSDMKDDYIISEFDYSPLNGGSGYNAGELSHDNSMIAINPSFKEGVVLVDTSGELIAHIFDINGQKIDQNAESKWMPDNSLLITHNKYIIKLAPPYNTASVVREMNYEDWGDLAVDPSGKKIAVRINKHIHMMNLDGSDMVQVTDSDGTEANPEFSPDGSHLLVGTEYRKTGNFGAIWNLKIIPADGKLYKVNSKEVTPIISLGEDSSETASGRMAWR